MRVSFTLNSFNINRKNFKKNSKNQKYRKKTENSENSERQKKIRKSFEIQKLSCHFRRSGNPAISINDVGVKRVYYEKSRGFGIYELKIKSANVCKHVRL
jgi:hypothetical protein